MCSDSIVILICITVQAQGSWHVQVLGIAVLESSCLGPRGRPFCLFAPRPQYLLLESSCVRILQAPVRQFEVEKTRRSGLLVESPRLTIGDFPSPDHIARFFNASLSSTVRIIWNIIGKGDPELQATASCCGICICSCTKPLGGRRAASTLSTGR